MSCPELWLSFGFLTFKCRCYTLAVFARLGKQFITGKINTGTTKGEIPVSKGVPFLLRGSQQETRHEVLSFQDPNKLGRWKP